MKFLSFIAMAAFVLVLMGNCKKKEEPKPEIPLNPMQLMGEQEDEKSEQPSKAPEAKGNFHGDKPELRIIVPDHVKNKWDSVKLSIEDRKLKKTDTVIIKLGEEYVIRDSGLKIRVGDFLPDFRMDALTITSASDRPNNPAVKVIITGDDEEIFHGWLYSKFPAIQPFST